MPFSKKCGQPIFYILKNRLHKITWLHYYINISASTDWNPTNLGLFEVVIYVYKFLDGLVKYLWRYYILKYNYTAITLQL